MAPQVREKATQAMQGGINKELEVKLVDMENAASTTDDMELEAHDDPKPRKEDQLEDLRGGAVAGAAVQGDEDGAVEPRGNADDGSKTAGDGGEHHA